MVAWNHGNQTRRDQQPVTWMGCDGSGRRCRMSKVEIDFHRGFGDGPTGQQLIERLGSSPGYNENQHKQLLKNNECMRYTQTGEGCLLRKRIDAKTPTTSIRPGLDSIQIGTAETALEAANANQFYPDVVHKIMKAGFTCSDDFPYEKVKDESDSAIEYVAINRGLAWEGILEMLPYTSRANLAQCSSTMALAISNDHTMWSLSLTEMSNAEFTDEEYERSDDQELSALGPPRGAKDLMVVAHAMHYNPRSGFRQRAKYETLGLNTLRMLRAFDLWGTTVVNLCLKHIPFINHTVARGIIEACPNLKRFEMISCGATSFMDIADLLNHLKEVQDTRKKSIYFDASPYFDKGLGWADNVPCEEKASSDYANYATYERQGTFGVSYAEPGVDLPVAILKMVVYHVGPAAKAAGQLHMLYDMSSVCRQSLEAHALPNDSIELMLRAWEIQEKMSTLIAAAKRKWDIAHAGQTPMPPFKYEHWSWELVNEIDTLKCPFNWCAVRACYGENGYKQTMDRGHYSTDYKCTTANYEEFSKLMMCTDGCGMSLPRYHFNACEKCEACRLQDWKEVKDGAHLQNRVKIAVEQLTYKGATALWQPVSNRLEWRRRVLTTPALIPFIRECLYMDTLPGGRRCIPQREHPYGGNPTMSDQNATILLRQCYRRTVTHEEHDEACGLGWAPKHRVASYGQW